MARINNLTNFLNDVSSAIKQKTGDSTPIPAADFDTEILSIETPGAYQEKSIEITQNGNYNLLPDTGYDALSNARISVNVEGGSGDTSDATAQADDVFYPKTFYARGSKLTGSALLNSVPVGESLYDGTMQIPALKTADTWSITPDERYLVYINNLSVLYVKDLVLGSSVSLDLTGTVLNKNWGMINSSFVNDNKFYIGLVNSEGYVGSITYTTNTGTLSDAQIVQFSYTYTFGYLIRPNTIQNKFIIFCGNGYGHYVGIYDITNNTVTQIATGGETFPDGLAQLDKYDRFLTFAYRGRYHTQSVMWFDSNLGVTTTTGFIISNVYCTFFYNNNNEAFMYNPRDNQYTKVTIDGTNHTITPTGSYITPDLSGVTTSRYGNSLLTSKILSQWITSGNTIISDLATISNTSSATALQTNQLYEYGNKWYYADTTNNIIRTMGINYQGVKYTSVVTKNITFPNTGDATAKASDIALNKTAYVNGEKITGTYDGDPEYATNLSLSNQILGITAPYTELEYVESTGTQYINVGYRHNANTKVEIKFYMSSSNTRDYVGLFGARNTSFRSNAYTFFTRFNYGNFCYNRSGNEATGTSVYDNWITLTTYGTTATYTDGTTTRNITTSGTADAGVNDWLLFNINTAGSDGVSPDSPDNSGLRIAYFKVWDDNGTTLVRDLIPVKRNSDNVICLYDKMSGEYFTNQGTGNFTPGPEV